MHVHGYPRGTGWRETWSRERLSLHPKKPPKSTRVRRELQPSRVEGSWEGMGAGDGQGDG